MAYNEDEYLQLSGIQHFRFCRRQWALIHIEDLWAENSRTADGEIMHENAHNSDMRERRAGLIVTRSLPIASPTLGVSGSCDVVEFRASDDGYRCQTSPDCISPTPLSTSTARPGRTAQMSCSSAGRPCALKKCFAAISKKARCISERRIGALKSSLLPSFAKT